MAANSINVAISGFVASSAIVMLAWQGNFIHQAEADSALVNRSIPASDKVQQSSAGAESIGQSASSSQNASWHSREYWNEVGLLLHSLG